MSWRHRARARERTVQGRTNGLVWKDYPQGQGRYLWNLDIPMQLILNSWNNNVFVIVFEVFGSNPVFEKNAENFAKSKQSNSMETEHIF